MPPRRRWRAALVAAVVLTLLPAAASATSDRGRDVHRSPERILGFDGLEYDSAPVVVEGSGGDLFLGLEFDLACAWGGELFEQGVRRLAGLARIINESGRRAVFTIAPDKSDAMRHHLPATLPQGDCSRAGLVDQRRVMDRFAHPTYLPLRRAIAADQRQTYWKTDQHWTEVGVSHFARAVAAALDPVLARRQRYRSASQTQVGYLNAIRGLDTSETVRSVRYGGKVTVRTAPGSPWPMGSGHTEVRWRSRPAAKTWPGRTLLLGDSFSVVGLDSLAPLFRRGRFLWNNNFSDREVAEAVAEADTVVIEVAQFILVGNSLGSASLRHAVKRELRRHG